MIMYTKLESTGIISIHINISYFIFGLNAKMLNSGILHLRAVITVILPYSAAFILMVSYYNAFNRWGHKRLTAGTMRRCRA